MAFGGTVKWDVSHIVETKATSKGFWDAILVWLRKPHVVNRRLCGAELLWQQAGVSLDTDVLSFSALLKDKSWSKDSHWSELLSVLQREQAAVRQEAKSEVFVRDLLPKQLDRFPRVREVVIFDEASSLAIFLPVYILDGSGTFISSCSQEDLPYALKYCEAGKKIELLVYKQHCDTGNLPSSSANLSNPASQANDPPTDLMNRTDHYSKPVNECETNSPHTTTDVVLLNEAHESTPSENDAQMQDVSLHSMDWLTNVLLVKLARWAAEDNLNTEVTSLKLVSVDRYNQVYQRLKTKYGLHLVSIWPESTDPQKFVYEDIAIAAYLLVLWEKERENSPSPLAHQSFVDLGCGNGLLVYLLNMEGHPGLGLDVRKRKIWDLYGPNIKLKECTITPSDEMLFPDYDWLIGNHSDELTPWIPVITARSSYKSCYFVLPCCPWDFNSKFSGKGSKVKASCQGSKVKGQPSVSQYGAYLEFVRDVGVQCGFEVEDDVLRIPSTKRICFIGKSRTYPVESEGSIDLRRSNYIAERCKSNLPKSVSGDQNGGLTPENTLQGESSASEEGSAKRIKIVSDICCSNVNEEISEKSNQSAWTSDFQARSSEEKPRNCVTVDSKIKDKIVGAVFKAVLESTAATVIHLEDGRTWNKGGKLELSKVAGMFDREILGQLKNECGGLQTLLRNCHHVFQVQGGSVQLRDWTSQDFVTYQENKRKRKGQQKKSEASQLSKTRLCYFYVNHPNGCPLVKEKCRYAHGTEELRERVLVKMD